MQGDLHEDHFVLTRRDADEPWGFFFGVISNGPQILKVTLGSPAHGKLKAGQIISSIDEQSVLNLKREDVLILINNDSQILSLKVYTPSPGEKQNLKFGMDFRGFDIPRFQGRRCSDAPPVEKGSMMKNWRTQNSQGSTEYLEGKSSPSQGSINMPNVLNEFKALSEKRRIQRQCTAAKFEEARMRRCASVDRTLTPPITTKSTSGTPAEGSSNKQPARNYSPQNDTRDSPSRIHDFGEEQPLIYEPGRIDQVNDGLSSIRYMGVQIPSKTFRALAQMVGFDPSGENFSDTDLRIVKSQEPCKTVLDVRAASQHKKEDSEEINRLESHVLSSDLTSNCLKSGLKENHTESHDFPISHGCYNNNSNQDIQNKGLFADDKQNVNSPCDYICQPSSILPEIHDIKELSDHTFLARNKDCHGAYDIDSINKPQLFTTNADTNKVYDDNNYIVNPAISVDSKLEKNNHLDTNLYEDTEKNKELVSSMHKASEIDYIENHNNENSKNKEGFDINKSTNAKGDHAKIIVTHLENEKQINTEPHKDKLDTKPSDLFDYDRSDKIQSHLQNDVKIPVRFDSETAKNTMDCYINCNQSESMDFKDTPEESISDSKFPSIIPIQVAGTTNINFVSDEVTNCEGSLTEMNDSNRGQRIPVQINVCSDESLKHPRDTLQTTSRRDEKSYIIPVRICNN